MNDLNKTDYSLVLYCVLHINIVIKRIIALIKLEELALFKIIYISVRLFERGTKAQGCACLRQGQAYLSKADAAIASH